MSTSSLTTLGTTLAATCSTEPRGTLAAGTLGAAPPIARRAGWALWLCQQCHSTADAGRDDRDGQRGCGQSDCARTLLGSNDRRAGRGLRGAPVRVVGCAESLLRRVAPVVRLLLVRAGPLRTGVSGATAHTRRAAHPAAGVAASTSDDLSCRCSALPQVGSDIENNDGCIATVPVWAENPLREHSGHSQISSPMTGAPDQHCRR